MSDYSRRWFIKATSAACAVGIVRPGLSMPVCLSAEDILSQQYAFDDVDMRAFAMRALDVARSSGAEFADVRINVGRSLSVSIDKGEPGLSLGFTLSAGVRAAVASTWGFAGSSSVTLDGIAEIAGLAVERAKAGRPRKLHAFDFAPAPVVSDGVWQTAVEQDPFTVPLAEQQERWSDAYAYAQKSVPSLKKYRGKLSGASSWMRSDRVFASTEGSFIKQRIYYAHCGGNVSVGPPNDYTRWGGASVKGLATGGYGYEAVSKVNLKESWREAAEDAVQDAIRLSSISSVKSVDVGRYDLVLSARVLGNLVVTTIAPALDLERALGQKANGAGTTYAMPPMDMVGKYQIASNLLTVTADRSKPHSASTVGWDEEGVKPDVFTLVKDGVVADYISTRTSASALAEWYRTRGELVKSHGCAVRTGYEKPILQIPNITVRPNANDATVDDLIRGVKKGLYVKMASGADTDQQLINTQVKGNEVYEISNGKLGRLVDDMAFQFNTTKFWQSLSALGGESSRVSDDRYMDSSLPTRTPSITLESVAGLVRDVNVVNIGKNG